MDASLIPARYAKALFDYAKELDMDKEVYHNMKILSNSFQSVPLLTRTLQNPVVSNEDKRKLIITAAGGEDDVCEVFRKFIDLVVRNNREASLHFMALKYRDTFREKNNIYYGKLTTVVHWNNASIEKLKKIILQGREGSVEFHYVNDPSIIGGFIIEYDCNLLDASVAGQFKQINQELVEKNRRIV